MPTVLAKKVERKLTTFQDRGRDVVVRVVPEGVYLKADGQRWTSAVFAPWAAIFSTACKMELQRNIGSTRKPRIRRGLL